MTSRTCSVGWCRFHRAEDRYCALHAALPPEVLQDAAAYDAVSRAEKSLRFIEREAMRLYLGYMDGYNYTVEEIARIFLRSDGDSLKRDTRRMRRYLKRSALSLLDSTRFPELSKLRDRNAARSIYVVSSHLLDELASNPRGLHEVSSRRFEEVVAHVVRQFGFSVELTARSADGGRDVICLATDALGIQTSYIIECKKWAPDRPVGVEVVRALYGVKAAEGRDHAIVATTSHFTRGAIEYSQKPRVLNLHLRDFRRVAHWIKSASGHELEERLEVGTRRRVLLP